MSDHTETATIQQLRGGTQWHCPDVSCSYVDAADLPLDGPTRDVTWDGDERRLHVVGEDETMGLSNVCNRCRYEKGWRAAWINS